MLERCVVGVVLACALCVLACSGSGGSADAGSQGGGGTGGGGTGGGGTGTGGASSVNRTPFLGNWTAAVTIAVSGSCPNVEPVTDTEQVVVSAGTTTDLVREPTSGSPCAVPLNIVSATQAMLARPIQCSFSSSVSSGTYDFSSWTFTISGDTGTESASGTVTLSAVGLTCPTSLSTTLTR